MPVKNVHHVDLRVPKDLWDEVRELAESENRSINSQIITLLQIAMAQTHQKNGNRKDRE